MVNPLGKDCTADSTVEHKQMRKGSEEGTFCDQVHSVFCPDCQGTGLQIEGGALEKPDVPLSEVCCLQSTSIFDTIIATCVYVSCFST